jgi:hypothetical protein
MWHCPHCGAPQAESARCWVCRRSSTTCSTCRHFRASLATDVGYCGKDRARTPLTGLELRPCWEEDAGSRASHGREEAPDGGRRRPEATIRGGGGPLDRPDPMRLRGFVPIDELAGAPLRLSAGEAPGDGPHEAVPPAVLRDGPDWASQSSLFGEADG